MLAPPDVEKGMERPREKYSVRVLPRVFKLEDVNVM
jgi:hypothetical protein